MRDKALAYIDHNLPELSAVASLIRQKYGFKMDYNPEQGSYIHKFNAREHIIIEDDNYIFDMSDNPNGNRFVSMTYSGKGWAGGAPCDSMTEIYHHIDKYLERRSTRY